MPTLLDARRGSLAEVHEALARTLEEVGRDREVNPLSIAAPLRSALDADWLVHRSAEGEWTAVRPGGGSAGPAAEPASRRIDFARLRELPRRRLIRLGGPVLQRMPRLADQGLAEVLVYLAPSRAHGSAFVALGLGAPLAVDHGELESVLRSWLALDGLQERMRFARDESLAADAARRAACVLHDLRHELTVAGLELERAAHEPGGPAPGALDRVRDAVAGAASLCERGLAPASPADPEPVLLLGLLREETFTARAVAGRGERVQVEIACDPGLESRVDRRTLGRIVRNLLLNAIEGSPDGSSVSLSAERGDDLVLRIADRGRGMSAADRRDWSRFGRSGRGGWGIGTASVEACARAIGATARIESSPAGGTSIEIRVPTARHGAPG
jgi:signal transduction histidine kinase